MGRLHLPTACRHLRAGCCSYQCGAGTYQFVSGTYQPNAGTYQFGPGTYQPNAGTYQFGSGAYQDSPGMDQRCRHLPTGLPSTNGASAYLAPSPTNRTNSAGIHSRKNLRIERLPPMGHMYRPGRARLDRVDRGKPRPGRPVYIGS